MAKIRYIGMFDEVEIDVSLDSSGRWEKVKKNHQIEVPDEIAFGVPAPDGQPEPTVRVMGDRTPVSNYDPGRGGLLDQTDNWALVESPAAKKEKAD